MINLRQILMVIFRHKGKLILVFSLFVIPVLYLSFVGKSIYQADSKLMINRSQNPNLVGTEKLTIAQDEEINSELEIIKSRPVMEKMIDKWLTQNIAQADSFEYMLPEYLDSQIGREKLIEILTEELSVDALGSSNIINIKLKGKHSEEITEIVNALSQSYIEYSVKLQNPFQTEDFLEERIKDTRAKIDSLEKSLNQIKQEQGIVDYTKQEQLLLDRFGNFESRITEIEKNIITLEARISQMQQSIIDSPETIVPDKIIDSNPIILSLKQKIIELKMRQNELSEKYTPQHRAVQMVKEEISKTYEELRNQVKEAIVLEQTAINALVAEKSALKSTLAYLKKTIHTLPEKQRVINKLRMTIEDSKKVYSLLIQKYEETRIAAASDPRVSRVIVISDAIPSQLPIGPKRIRNIILAIFFGFTAALGFIFFIDFSDHTFRDNFDVEDKLGLPFLASFRDGSLTKTIKQS